jgi:ribosomal protein L34E
MSLLFERRLMKLLPYTTSTSKLKEVKARRPARQRRATRPRRRLNRPLLSALCTANILNDLFSHISRIVIQLLVLVGKSFAHFSCLGVTRLRSPMSIGFMISLFHHLFGTTVLIDYVRALIDTALSGLIPTICTGAPSFIVLLGSDPGQ